MTFIIWGGLLFWTIIGIEIFILTIAMIYERFIPATVSFIVTIALFQVCSNVNLWKILKTDWLTFLSYFVLYIVIGLIWSVVKFKLKTRKIRREFLTRKESGLYSHNYIPTFEFLTSKIVGWTTYWPFSILAFLLEDFLKEIITFIWETCLVGLFKRIYEKDLSDLKKIMDEEDARRKS
jgi:hypothetical protein